MRRTSLSLLVGGLFFIMAPGWSQSNSCDLTNDGRVDAADVQASINMSLGISPCSANIAGANVCNVVVVQRVVNASLGGSCFTSAGIHSVSLNWAASTSTGVTGYNVYRSTPNGSFTLISSLGNVLSYTDNGVQSGVSYVYVVRASNGTTESIDSNQTQAVVPIP
jgi:hypothetical protein